MTGSRLPIDASRPRTDADKGASQPLFLSLFLLLLAFFILLNSLSSIEEGRSSEVLQSVQQAFPSDLRARLKESFLDGDPGQVIGDGLRARLGVAFEETLPVVEIAADPSGSPLYVEVPAASVYAAPLGAVTPSAEELARRLAPMIAEPAPGSVLELEVLFGRDASSATSDAIILAAAATVRRFVALGVPAGRISAGAEARDPSVVRFVFRIRPSGEG